MCGLLVTWYRSQLNWEELVLGSAPLNVSISSADGMLAVSAFSSPDWNVPKHYSLPFNQFTPEIDLFDRVHARTIHYRWDLAGIRFRHFSLGRDYTHRVVWAPYPWVVAPLALLTVWLLRNNFKLNPRGELLEAAPQSVEQV
jgi:hypothetical protein